MTEYKRLKGFTEEENEAIRLAILRAWQAVGADALSSIAEATGRARMSKAEVVEVALDADRPREYGKLDAALHERFRDLGWPRMCRFAGQFLTAEVL